MVKWLTCHWMAWTAAFLLGGAAALWSAESAYAFSGEGEGTQTSPFIIKTAAQLAEMNDDLDAYYELGAHIDLTGVSWSPIDSFSGHFDGKGYTISNLEITGTANDEGLFGSVVDATVRNVGLFACGYHRRSKGRGISRFCI